MKIKESIPFRKHLAACERFSKKKGVFCTADNTMQIEASIVEQHAQEIYNSLTGCGLTYFQTVLIREIVWDQLRLERDCKTL